MLCLSPGDLLDPGIKLVSPMSPVLAGGYFTTQFNSVTQWCLTLRPHESQHARPPCPLPTPGVYPLVPNYWSHHLQIFSTSLWFVFSFCLFIYLFFSVRKLLGLLQILFVYFWFYFHYSGRKKFEKDIAVIFVRVCSAYVFP